MSGAIAVLGGGAWGVALALTVLRQGAPVRLWARDAEAVRQIASGTLDRYLPGISFETGIAATTNIAQVLSGVDCVLVATPAQALRDVLAAARPHLAPAATLVLCAKGIESHSGMLLSQIAAELCPDHATATLSGPSFAADVARGLPTAVVVAAPDGEAAFALATRLSSETFRCYSTDDQVGVEVGGALKNVIALAAGAALGAGLGASAQAALVTRGFIELRRIGAAFGARPETLMGLSGLGDLLLTCSSAQSRNFAYGMALGRGEDQTGRPLAEGVATARIAARLAAEHGIEAPIVSAVSLILDGRMSIGQAVASLMSRALKAETE